MNVSSKTQAATVDATAATEGRALRDRPVTLLKPSRGWVSLDLRELWNYRDLFYFLVLRDISVMYKQTVLGVAWAVITPFFSMVVFSIVFGYLLGVASDGRPYPVFSLAALLPWTYFASAFNASTGSLITGTAVFTKVYFPRVFLPMVPIVSKFVDFAIAAVMLAVMMVYYKVMPSWNVLLLPLPMLLLVLTASGAGMWLSALAIQYRDIRHAMSFFVQILMYAAPVVWPVSKLPEHLRLWYGLYPMAGVIEGFRAALLGSQPMPWDLLAMGTPTAIGLFLIGLAYFRRTERFFADVA